LHEGSTFTAVWLFFDNAVKDLHVKMWSKRLLSKIHVLYIIYIYIYIYNIYIYIYIGRRNMHVCRLYYIYIYITLLHFGVVEHSAELLMGVY
jgi:hypothetical protein